MACQQITRIIRMSRQKNWTTDKYYKGIGIVYSPRDLDSRGLIKLRPRPSKAAKMAREPMVRKITGMVNRVRKVNLSEAISCNKNIFEWPNSSNRRTSASTAKTSNTN